MLGHSIFIQSSVLLSSVNHLCLTPCNCMNHSTPGLPFHHQLPESIQTHVHGVSNAIQPSHPLLSPAPLAFNRSQHQGLFKWVSSSHQLAKVLELQLWYQPFQWIFRVISFRSSFRFDLTVQRTLKNIRQHHSSKANSLALNLLFKYIST